MIELKNLVKKYGKFTAVENLSITVKKGEIFGFLGPNGAGKTTTIKIMTGLLKPTSGEALVGGFDIQKDPVSVKKIIGFIPDRPYIYEKLTGKEFLDFIAGVFKLDKTSSKRKAAELLALFEIDKWGDELIESYSHGMKQKLVMASNILHDPEIYIIDEPMVGLDPKSAKIVREMFLDLKKAGKTLFISTHSLEIVESLCDTIGIIQNAGLIAKGSMEELRASSKSGSRNLEDIFLSLTGAPDLAGVLNYISGEK